VVPLDFITKILYAFIGSTLRAAFPSIRFFLI